VDAASFLATVSGAGAGVPGGGAANPGTGVRIGTVDPSYDPFVGYPAACPLPKITFDGEGTLSGRQYAILNGYVPAAGDRVLLVPVGNTFIVLGRVSSQSPQGFYQTNAGFYGVELGEGAYYDESSGMVVPAAIVGGKQLIQNEGGLEVAAFGAGLNSSGFGFQNMPATSSVSFTKQYSAAKSKIYVLMSISGFVTNGNCTMRFGVNVNSSDYDIGQMWVNVAQANSHLRLAHWRYITGLAAGTYTFQGRFASPYGYTMTIDTNDYLSLHLREVPV
jgi:hypothetical protein